MDGHLDAFGALVHLGRHTERQPAIFSLREAHTY
jgi:hypothetical protein